MYPYICGWCGGLENKDEPIYDDNQKFCSKSCLDKYRQSFRRKLIEQVITEEISFLDLPKWLRDETSGRKRRRFSTISHNCVVCGALFYSYPSDPKTCCSTDCHIKRIKEIADRNRLINIGWTIPAWKGGISHGEYCPKFNEDLKNRVRLFFDNKCFLCGKPQSRGTRKLSVHHVNYDKNVCCNDKPALFVPLCTNCHMKTNHNRKEWEDKFESDLRDKYNYKCYYTKEEYSLFKDEVKFI